MSEKGLIQLTKLYIKLSKRVLFITQISSLINQSINQFINCRFSHDATKIQTTKLLILLIFYFNEV